MGVTCAVEKTKKEDIGSRQKQQLKQHRSMKQQYIFWKLQYLWLPSSSFLQGSRQDI